MGILQLYHTLTAVSAEWNARAIDYCGALY